MRKDALLDLVITNKEGFTEHMKVEGSLRCNDHETQELVILR